MWKKSESGDYDQTEMCIDKVMKWSNNKRSGFDFHDETEAAMNEQINIELKAFYYYLSMVCKNSIISLFLNIKQ